jgi:arylsulfatase A-like enzyme
MRIETRWLFALSAVSMMLVGTWSAARAADQPRPNILFIYADDQSYKTLSCYDGHPDWVKTPNIDRLAASGVRFHRSYLGAWCMPSRASLLTGRLQHAVMSMTMEGQYPGSKYDPAQCPFVPAQFRAQGYQTAQIGKWHTGADTGFGRDWDYQIVWNRPGNPGNAGSYYTDQLLTYNGVDKKTDGYSTDNYTRWAVDYIQGQHRAADKPWYLWLCYGAIHGPTTPAERHQGKLAGMKAPLPADIVGPWPEKPRYLEKTQAWMMNPQGVPAMAKKGQKKDNFDSNVAGKEYHAWVQQVNECMMAVDEGVGQVMEALRASGQLENTLVVYSADQGYGLGEHGFNQKVAPYDATVASPMIISWPGKVPAGKLCQHPINAPDLIDYFCRTAQVTIPWKTHGRDIRPLLANPETTQWDSPLLMTHTSRNYGAETDQIPTDESLTSSSGVPWYALLRDGKYKYIRNFVEGETEELYDLVADPEELQNLAGRPEQAARLVELRMKALAELKRTDAGFIERLPKTKAQLVSTKIAGSVYSLDKSDDKVVVKLGDDTFAEYVLNDPATNKSYLWPVYGPSQRSVTRSYPMQVVDGEQHDHYHHRGIWFGHESIGGYDTWAEAKTFQGDEKKKASAASAERLGKLGRQLHRGFRSLTAGTDRAVLESDVDYVAADGKKLLAEIRTLTFHHDAQFRYIDWDQTFIASEGDVVFDDKKDAGLSIRVPTAMAVDSKQGGLLFSSEGRRDKEAWGKRSRWCEYYGTMGGEPMGIAMLNHPASFRSPTTWHIRTYGLFTANPFGTLDPESPNGPYTLPAGQSLRLKHRFVLHDGELSETQLNELYQAYAGGQ